MRLCHEAAKCKLKAATQKKVGAVVEVISHGKLVCARCSMKGLSICNLSRPVPPDKEVGLERARLGPAARLGPQPPGVRLEPRIVHGGIIGEIQAKGRRFP